ncbi:radical SAM family heme chaperone HemW [Galbibacter sp.]|uniref:radical SAM family heme chaperone HemW n=1 Tax=Galbibacter sp. TaxID=2918471 RepID=UPI002CCE3FBD|nr:radical SAM family heme chaperone HemW [Galbibacter sp.]HLV64142.1 radical SAM family heme chaperone HemW [Galbibacter sp.]
MAGIYIHIPFCKQACSYCDFHFSTSLKKKDALVDALAKEILLRRDTFDHTIDTIYFGGGTPSLLPAQQIEFLINEVYKRYAVNPTPEITLEANPDDLDEPKIKALKNIGINRLSLGIQSFNNQDLKLMNRAHSAEESLHCLKIATKYFENISIDLIYGVQYMTIDRWRKNIQTVLDFNIPHISSYALTIEPKTALASRIRSGQLPHVDDALAASHFEILIEQLIAQGYIHYELSNFGKPGYFSKNNTAYWLGKKYLGIGPSAHSYDGNNRSWNISNNTLYIKSLDNDTVPSEEEVLSTIDRYNEAIMTGLRTMWGVSLFKIENKFGAQYHRYLLKQSKRYIESGLLQIDQESKTIKATPKGKFLTDGIASDLFFVE